MFCTQKLNFKVEILAKKNFTREMSVETRKLARYSMLECKQKELLTHS